MEVFSSYTLSSPDASRPYLASNSRPGNLATDSDVDDDRPGRHSPVEIFYVDDRRHTRDRVSIFDDRDRRDDETDVEANSSPPLT